MVKIIEKQELEIMSHKLVPFHEIISEKERKELLEKFKITPEQLPKILNTDPVCSSIGAQPGQIVKVVRKSRTSKEAVAYRLIVESND